MAHDIGPAAKRHPDMTFLVYHSGFDTGVKEGPYDPQAKAGADVLISNHTIFDGSKTKIPALERRKPGDPNPYVIGQNGVQRYLTVVDECAQAGLANAKAQ